MCKCHCSMLIPEYNIDAGDVLSISKQVFECVANVDIRDKFIYLKTRVLFWFHFLLAFVWKP